MTTGIILGTSQTKEYVCEVIEQLGFKVPVLVGDYYQHSTIDDLVLDIISEKNRILIGFLNKSQKFPACPEVIKVLRDIYSLLPDLDYYEITFPSGKTFKGPVSEFLKAYE